MNSDQPIVLPPPTPKTLCPICGKATYSRGGIHPQCAMQQADAPRLLKLRATKVAVSKPEKKTRQWKKKCPKCGTQLHVRREVCECGHKFSR